MNWIKKGDRTPNHNGENVLLTVKLGNAITVIEGWGDFYGFYSNKINITSEVIAWTPMPKPFVDETTK